MYILEDDLETELGLPQGEFDVPLVIADHAFNKDGSFRYAENVDLGFRGDTILVNGAVSPRMAVQRRKYRLRFLNASNARSYTLRLGRGRAMQQIAGDGGLLERPVPRARVPLHPAERVDLVLDFSAYGPGDEIVLHNEDGSGGTVPIMRFDVVGGGEREQFKVPSRLRPLEPLPGANARRRWELGLGTSAWQINGLGFEPTRIDARPRLAAQRYGRSSTAPTACTRCTSTASSSACSSARARRWRPRTGSAGRTPSACCPTRPSPCSPGSRPTRASTSSTATRSNTPTRR